MAAGYGCLIYFFFTLFMICLVLRPKHQQTIKQDRTLKICLSRPKPRPNSYVHAVSFQTETHHRNIPRLRANSTGYLSRPNPSPKHPETKTELLQCVFPDETHHRNIPRPRPNSYDLSFQTETKTETFRD